MERGTLPGQRTVAAPLAEIADAVAAAGVRPPAVTLVGSVARLREGLEWIERRPLHGRRVVVTRARAQASGLAATLRALGADVIEAPAIRIEPRAVDGDLARALDAIETYDLICLTSANGAALLLDGLLERGRDARALAGLTVAAIGPGTSRELERRGVRADIVPERSVAESLLEALARSRAARTPAFSSRARLRRATSCRTASPSGARTSTWWRSTTPSARSSAPRCSRRWPQPTT